jgi:inhibitor of KinA
MSFSIQPLGDSAITITFGNSIDDQLHHQVVALYQTLEKQNMPLVKDIIPAYASLTVVYDIMKVKEVCEETAYKYMHDVLMQTLKQQQPPQGSDKKTIRIPACYDVSLGLDLVYISEQKHMTIDEIINLHSSITYRVYMLGFLPGFAYMGKVDERIATSRKATPAQNILAGSIGIADAQTGIYPFNSPGGWNIIGQTPEPLFYPHLNEPCLFAIGDMVKFEPITLEEFYELKEA